MRSAILGILMLFLATTVTGQKQLVLLKQERTLLVLNPGDDIVIRLKGEKEIIRSFINNLSDTSVVLRNDTIALHQIDRIYFRNSSFHNTVGTVLVIAGVGYFLIDQLNNTVVRGNDARLDSDVNMSSLVMTGVGLPLMLLRKKYKRIGHKVRLISVKEGSPFYRKPISRTF